MSSNYDNWERLVEAVLDREKLRQLAREDSLETITSDFSSTIEGELRVSDVLREFSFNDLTKATRGFGPDSVIGEGDFGLVFKGRIEENGTGPAKPGLGIPVAVKSLNHDGIRAPTGCLALKTLDHDEIGHWLAGVKFLGDLAHPNLLKLIGYCVGDHQRLLVYEYMPKGSLGQSLFRNGWQLPWLIRMRIAVDVAKGLAFLHEEAEKPVIHGDIKSSNILLDAEYNAKLSYFGLAGDGLYKGKSTSASIYDYAAPEYGTTGHLTSKSDVYSFGVVLLEILTGRRLMDENRPHNEQNLVELARPYFGNRKLLYRLIDPRLEGPFPIKGARKASEVAARCLSQDPKARPLMSEVVEALKPLPNLNDMSST